MAVNKSFCSSLWTELIVTLRTLWFIVSAQVLKFLSTAVQVQLDPQTIDCWVVFRMHCLVLGSRCSDTLSNCVHMGSFLMIDKSICLSPF